MNCTKYIFQYFQLVNHSIGGINPFHVYVLRPVHNMQIWCDLMCNILFLMDTNVWLGGKCS